MTTKFPFAISPIDTAERAKNLPKAGMTIRVWQKIKEKDSKGKDRVRLQAFEGLVISARHGAEAGASFSVRRVASGVGVEKTFPLYSPNIDRIEILRRAKVRRAKLYYIRDKSARDVRRKMKQMALDAGLIGTPAAASEVSEEAVSETA